MPESRIEVHHTLPCGCELHQSLLRTHNDGTKWVITLGKLAQFWLEDRIARHRCELVSEANPSGVAPKQPTPQGE
jgi:hypothetical protein